jgi:hypothetical protein
MIRPLEPQAPGLYSNVAFCDYTEWSNVSVHMLHSLAKSPAHLLAALAEPRKRTPAMTFGAAVHAAILEPHQFARWYANALDLDRRSKLGRAAHEAAAAGGVTLLKPDQWSAIQAMTAAIRSHPFASILLNPAEGEAEVSVAWIDGETGVPCRSRPDYINSAHNVIVDLKTTQDASMGSFARSCAQYRYHVQAAFYLAAASAVGLNAQAFIFVAIETAAPWACACYELAPHDLQLGGTLYREGLRVYQQCMETGVWNGYPQEVRILELPQWARFVPVS